MTLQIPVSDFPRIVETNRQSTVRQFVNLLKIRRIEFLIAEVPLFGIPATLAVSDIGELCSWRFVEFIALFFLLFNLGDMLNCLCDRDIDTAEKSYLSRAIAELGTPSVICQVIMTALASVAISIHLACTTGKPHLIACTIIGIALAAAYSVPPVRFKSRGILQVLWYWGVLFFASMLFTILMVTSEIEILHIGVIAAYATVQTGIVLINNAEDYFEDRKHNILTASVAMGLQKTITMAAALVILGGGLLFPLLAVEATSGGTTRAFYLILAAGSIIWMFIVKALASLRAKVDSKPAEESIVYIKRAAKLVPLWLTLIAWSTLIAGWMISIHRHSAG